MTLRSFSLAAAAGLVALHVQAQTFPGDPPGGGNPPGGGTPPGTTVTSPTLIGDSVTVTQYYPNLAITGLSSTVTVSSAVEIACPDSSVALCNADTGLLPGETIDIDSTSISGRFLGSFAADAGVTFNGFVFTGLNFGSGYSGISGFTLTTDMAGLTSDRVSFTANSLSINLLGLDPSVTTDGSGVGTYSITFAVAAVPEPGAGSLLAGGLGTLAFALRRRRLRDESIGPTHVQEQKP